MRSSRRRDHGSQAKRLLLGAGGLLLAACAPPPAYPLCEGDEHCRRAERGGWCVDGRCQACRTDRDCLVNERCAAAARCVARTECDAQRPCGRGLACANTRCVARPAGLAAPRLAAADQDARACALEPVYFAFRDASLDEAARRAVERDAACLRERAAPVVLVGYADPLGSVEYNLRLGERRARTVAASLVELGVPGERLSVESGGVVDAPAGDPARWAEARRVELRPR